MDENKKAIINLECESNKKLLIKFYNIWARRLWEENLVFYSLEIDCAVFYTNNTFENYLTEKGAQKWFKNFLNEFCKLEYIEVAHGASNFNKSGLLQVQMILGFRSHFYSISMIKNKLEALLAFCFEKPNFKLVYLSRFKDVLNLLCYLSRNFDKKRKFNYAFTGIYSHFYLKIHGEMFSIPDVDLGIEPTIFFIYYTGRNSSTIEYKLLPGKFHEIGSVSKFLLKEEAGGILYYLTFYFQKQNSIIYKKKLYLYCKKSGWSNEMLLIIESYIKEEIMIILAEIKKIFDFINIKSLYFLFCKHYKALIIKLIFLLKNQKYGHTLN